MAFGCRYEILLSKNNWDEFKIKETTFFIKGVVVGTNLARCLEKIERDISNSCDLSSSINELKGRFGIIVIYDEGVLAIVDKLRSVPLFYTEASPYIISDLASTVETKIGAKNIILDEEGILELRMAGFTTGRKTIYKNIRSILPGEIIHYHHASKSIDSIKYFSYIPDKGFNSTANNFKEELEELLLFIFTRVKEYANGRQIVIPLSAGFDSRLVVSLLKILGTKNIITYSYGKRRHYDVETASKISEKLNIPWHFVSYSIKNQKYFFQSDRYRNYVKFVDNCSSTPFVQDNFALEELQRKGIIDKDAIFINGNSGDFISGGHIPTSLFTRHSAPQFPTRKDIVNALIDKHYSLWINLLTSKNRMVISNELLSEINSIDFDESINLIHAFEYSEFNNRQSKYVVTGQQVYEFYGYNSLLPLWDDEFIEFWRNTPLEYKFNQMLYKLVIKERNWGNVWYDIKVNQSNIRPHWIRPVRYFAKFLHLALGKESWHKTERKYFSYWMDNTSKFSIVKYWDTISDRRDARNSVSWITDKYLEYKAHDFSRN